MAYDEFVARVIAWLQERHRCVVIPRCGSPYTRPRIRQRRFLDAKGLVRYVSLP